MDITPQADTTQKSISDDQELAKALAGVLPDAPEPTPTPPPVTPAPSTDAPVSGVPASAPSPAPTPESTPAPASGSPAPITPSTLPTPAGAPSSSDLDNIKKDALGELRPLIDKVDLPAEEKFDTYLMLIRSTDDSTLIAPAHAAAQGIKDEKRRAEALLDIVKEIDYLSRGNQPAA